MLSGRVKWWFFTIVLMAVIILVTLLQKLISRVFLEEGKDGQTFSERRARNRRLKQAGSRAVANERGRGQTYGA